MGDKRDVRILWEDVRGEAVTTIFGLLMCYVMADSHITFKKHYNDRIRQRHISHDEIFDVLRNGKLIEVHFLGNRCTVLLRKQRRNKAEDLIAVFDIVKGEVVSAYINDSNDHHDTLREELYDKDLDVQGLLEECIKKYSFIK